MAEKSSFFDSISSDRKYFAADWALHLSKYFTNGIFDNGLQVIANNDMTVNVKVGDANINGYRYTNNSEKTLNVAAADGVLNRIDNVVVRLDLANRQITTEIVKGDFAETAVAPTLTRGTTVYEIRLAKISVPAGTTGITSALVEDTRLNSTDCGNVICAVQTPNFTNVLNQYIALWDTFLQEKTENFEDWFNEMKGQLSTDAAGNLQLAISKLINNISFSEYGQSNIYEVSDYCIYNGILYKCIQAITSSEPFDEEKWDAVSITGELLNSLVCRNRPSVIQNLDRFINTGIYLLPASGTGSIDNVPTSLRNNDVFLMNIKCGDSIVQICARPATKHFLMREKYSSGNNSFTWSDWEEFADQDSGWQAITLTNYFKGYGNNSGNILNYRKKNGIVDIRGILTPQSNIAANTSANIGTLPEGYRPDYARTFVCQGSGICRWLLTIDTNGLMTFSRYGTNTQEQAPAGAWLPVSVMYSVG